MQAQEKKIYTPREYLDFEVASELRHEYINGEVIPMTGGTPNHNRISGNIYITLSLELKRKAYEVFHVDQRLWIPEFNIYTYPDVMVLPKPIQLQQGRKDTVVNPCFIAEVLSKSTQNYDRSEKFAAYRSINTFQEYLLVDQSQVHVEHYVKTGSNQWLFSEYTDLSITLFLSTLSLNMQLADLYENIDLTIQNRKN
ncbi:MAG: Uma2 family endonuclease [Coleofasciculaceae cyanobacterium SM2_1_6]|nr:Uma2 family endonuclease [Coleofasciculaceae cyanobacterium SM2_1_6]